MRPRRERRSSSRWIPYVVVAVVAIAWLCYFQAARTSDPGSFWRLPNTFLAVAATIVTFVVCCAVLAVAGAVVLLIRLIFRNAIEGVRERQNEETMIYRDVQSKQEPATSREPVTHGGRI